MAVMKMDGFRVIFEKFFKKRFILHCKSLILSEALFPDDMCGRNKTKNFVSFLPHMSFVKSSRRLTLVPEVLRVSCKTLKSLGEKSLEFWLKVLGVLSDPPGASRHTPGRMCPHALSHPPIRSVASVHTPSRIGLHALLYLPIRPIASAHTPSRIRLFALLYRPTHPHSSALPPAYFASHSLSSPPTCPITIAGQRYNGTTTATTCISMNAYYFVRHFSRKVEIHCHLHFSLQRFELQHLICSVGEISPTLAFNWLNRGKTTCFTST